MIQTINPATEAVIENYPVLSSEEASNAVQHAHQAYLDWRTTSFETRKSLFLKLASLLEQNKAFFAKLMAEEMGKPIESGQQEIEKCVWVCQHYAEQGEAYLADEVVQTTMKETRVVYKPLGVVFGIMPWNFPFWQVFRYAVPTLAAGNTTVLKHAPISSGSGAAIERLFIEAGFPNGVFQHLVLDNAVAAEVMAHPQVVGVTFTGSAKAGREIAATAGKHLKRVVLELGGSDPAVVLKDADISLAAQVITASRLNNTGQVCIAAKRIIVDKSIAKQLTDAIRSEIKAYTMGSPLLPETKLGPMARADLRDEVHRQVQASIAKGASLQLGGELPHDKGFYYPPTILTNVKPGMPAFDEEVFGPVVAIIEVESEKEAMALANQTEYGLGASLFTRDETRAKVMAEDNIEAGACFINGKVSSDPRVPFGGIKHSGFGRELGREGMLAFVNMKTVAIGHA